MRRVGRQSPVARRFCPAAGKLRNMIRVTRVGAICVFFTVVAAAAAQESKTAAPKPVVAVVGASVTAGFVNILSKAGPDRNRTVPMAKALEGAWPREQVKIRNFGDAVMFMDPVVRGTRQVERAAKLAPDLVIGVDFMIWFGYGHTGRPAGERTDARLALQKRGLALLEKVDCPVIIGDYPDMTGADPRMISPAQIPSPEGLAALNDALRAWAGRHANVTVFPLADWVANVKKNGEPLKFDGMEYSLTEKQLLQDDRLHATRLGMALMVERLLPLVTAALPEEHPLAGDGPGIEKIIRRVGADLDLPER